MFTMAELLTLSEVRKLTGLASHTIRYYENQFPKMLNVTRSKGGHRLYSPKHLDALNEIIRLLKCDRLTIKQARKVLGEDETENLNLKVIQKKSDTADLEILMNAILNKLERIALSNEKQQNILEQMLERGSDINKMDLLEQIKKCKLESSKTGHLYRSLIDRKSC